MEQNKLKEAIKKELPFASVERIDKLYLLFSDVNCKFSEWIFKSNIKPNILPEHKDIYTQPLFNYFIEKIYNKQSK